MLYSGYKRFYWICSVIYLLFYKISSQCQCDYQLPFPEKGWVPVTRYDSRMPRGGISAIDFTPPSVSGVKTVWRGIISFCLNSSLLALSPALEYDNRRATQRVRGGVRRATVAVTEMFTADMAGTLACGEGHFEPRNRQQAEREFTKFVRGRPFNQRVLKS